MIFLVKDFNINDSNLLELQIDILNIKSKWFCLKCSLKLRLGKPKMAACSVRSRRGKSFLKNIACSSHKFWIISHSQNMWNINSWWKSLQKGSSKCRRVFWNKKHCLKNNWEQLSRVTKCGGRYIYYFFEKGATE